MYMIMELMSNYLVISREPYVVFVLVFLSRLEVGGKLLWKVQFLFAVCSLVGEAEFGSFRTAVVSVGCETACWSSADRTGDNRLC